MKKKKNSNQLDDPFLFFYFRKRKRRLELITVLAREYPDMKNGLGPSRMKYIETKHEYKNGHSNKFHTFLKLSMMNNGTKIVCR